MNGNREPWFAHPCQRISASCLRWWRKKLNTGQLPCWRQVCARHARGPYPGLLRGVLCAQGRRRRRKGEWATVGSKGNKHRGKGLAFICHQCLLPMIIHWLSMPTSHHPTRRALLLFLPARCPDVHFPQDASAGTKRDKMVVKGKMYPRVRSVRRVVQMGGSARANSLALFQVVVCIGKRLARRRRAAQSHHT